MACITSPPTGIATIAEPKFTKIYYVIVGASKACKHVLLVNPFKFLTMYQVEQYTNSDAPHSHN